MDLTGTNPISGDSVDATDTSTYTDYLIGGTVIVGALMAGKGVVDFASDRLNIGATVSDTVMELS